MSARFVGRERELDVLRSLLERARTGHAPAAALVTGHPGSGKSRLLDELVVRVRGVHCVRVVGYEPIQPVPLASLSELFRQLAKVPEDGAALEALVFGSPEHPTRDTLPIFGATHRALSTFVPILFAVDDLQWVDERSLALLHYLLRAGEAARRSIVVVAAARPSAAAASFRASIEGELPDERRASLELGPLALEAGRALVREIDRELDEAGADDLWRRAGGLPFWLEALARGGGSSERSDLIEDRLQALSGDAGRLLAMLTVGGRPFIADDMAAALAWDVGRVRLAGRELVTRGLALETIGGFRLAHDLIRETVAKAIPAATSRRLHGDLARVIDERAGDDLGSLLEALEHHAAASRPAARLAARVLASPQRRQIGADGLRLIASMSDDLEPGSPDQVTLDSGVGELAALLGDQDLAIERWVRVGDRSLEPAVRQHAALEAARAAYRSARSAEARHHLDRARAGPAVTSTMFVELEALTAEIELWLDHETAAGCRTAARAVAAAEDMAAAAGGVEDLDAPARRAYLAALEAACDGALQEDRGADVIRLCETTAQVARELDEEAYVAALMRPGFALRPLGRIREAEARYRLAWDISRTRTMPTAMVEAGHGLARALRDLGRLAEARQVALETVQLESRLGHPPGRWGNAPSIVHTIDLAVGDPATALRALRLDAAAEHDPHYRLAIHQVIAAWQARFDGVRRARDVEAELEAARADAALARCPRCSAELAVVSAELLARIGRPEDASAALAAWEGQATATYLMREVWRGRARAAIAMARGDAREAAAILEASIEALRDTGLVDDLLWARIDHGRALASIDRSGAIHAFSEAARSAEAIGAVSQRRLISQALRQLGVRDWRRSRATSGAALELLTAREREVADLVADGASNREIAEALLVSPKTIERHLTNVLARLGLRNRTELAALVRSSSVRGSPDD